MRERLDRALPALAGLALFLVALEVLRRQLSALTWRTLSSDVFNTRLSVLAAAVALTGVNYAVLTAYDFIAFAYVGKKIPRRRVALTSFLAYAIANNVGFSILSGLSIRYRFYTRWGVTGKDLSRIVFSYTVTFWLGLLTLGGVTLAFSPLPRALNLPFSNAAAPVGWVLVGLSLAYVAASAIRREPLHIRKTELMLPPGKLAAEQWIVSCIDWTLAAAVFYIILPRSGATFLTVMGAFLSAQLLGMISHAPGGIGVFEALMVVLLGPFFQPSELAPALVVYRVVYYLLPLAAALAVLIADEARLRRADAARATAYLGRLTELLAPRVLAIFTFIGGLILLFSGATPAAAGRLRVLDRLLPLGVIEISHIIGSAAGAAMLLLSQGLARRLDAAYYLTAFAVSVGIVASLLKGGDYEEAVLLILFLLALRRARPAFDRKAAFFATRFSPAWIAAVVAALAASFWLGLFAYKHVEYSGDLWWQFALNAQASRFLRGSVAAATIVLLFAIARLLAHAPHEADEPSEEDLQTASAIISRQNATSPNLVYLRDKAVLFDEQWQGFVMYGVQRRTWVALRDPVGPPECIPGLIRLFLEKSDDFGGTPVFYEISEDNLHHYANFGLTFVKLGEEARVNLERFTLEGGRGAKFRQILRRLEKDGGVFRIVSRSDIPSIMNQLRDISDDWLGSKAVAEKGFSLGFFDADYILRFPVAVIERNGEIQAFANLWLGAGKDEMSVDLMRYRRDAPKGVMEALFAHMMKWGQQEGYSWFALGMAPMSGFEESPVAPLWTKAGIFLYEHGDSLYNFQGLRAFKEKFDPVWESRYLAYPGGLRLPRILADVAALVAGGYRRIFIH